MEWPWVDFEMIFSQLFEGYLGGRTFHIESRRLEVPFNIFGKSEKWVGSHILALPIIEIQFWKVLGEVCAAMINVNNVSCFGFLHLHWWFDGLRLWARPSTGCRRCPTQAMFSHTLLRFYHTKLHLGMITGYLSKLHRFPEYLYTAGSPISVAKSHYKLSLYDDLSGGVGEQRLMTMPMIWWPSHSPPQLNTCHAAVFLAIISL